MPGGYRLEDLVSATGVSYSRLRDWIADGLLPRAVRQGRYSHYPATVMVCNRREVDGQLVTIEERISTIELIRRIQAIKDANMTHRDIRDHFYPPEDAA